MCSTDRRCSGHALLHCTTGVLRQPDCERVDGIFSGLPEGDRPTAARVGEEHVLSDTERGDREGPASGQTSTLSGLWASLLNSCARRNRDSSCTDSSGCSCCGELAVGRLLEG